MNSLPLKGIRVIDFGQFIAGPLAAMNLADLGADVTHIDPPGGLRWKSPAAAMLNRGKTCVEFDLKSDEGLKEVGMLLRSADVVIENFRPGVMAGLGLAADVVRADNPGLIYLSLPGFASTDKQRAELKAWEAIIAAACGQYSDMGLNRVLMGVEPSFSPLPLASVYAAVLASGAITTALFKRDTTGHGDVIEVPLASALMEGLAYNSQNIENYPERYKSNREKEIDRRRKNNLPMDVHYEQLQELLDPFYRNYECADGRLLYVVSASHCNHPEHILRALGLWDTLVAEGLPRHYSYDNVADWQGDDCTITSYPFSQKWADRISGLLKKEFKKRPAYEWEHFFGSIIGAPVAAQRTTEEWLADEHALESGLVLEVDDPDFGRMRQLGSVAWLKNSAVKVKNSRRQVDRIGQITQAADKPIKGEQTAAGWLDGVKVLDLTNVIAGPTIASTLARYGAEVIKVDALFPSFDPWNGTIFWMHAGRGKRSLLLDLKKPAGQEVFDKLLRWADVLTLNAYDRQLEGIGIDDKRLKKVNPKLVVAQLDWGGGVATGSLSNCPGYDDLAQAVTGVMTRFGGSPKTPEEHAHFGTIDVLTGFCAVIGVGAALYQRNRTGAGDVARTSLCTAGQIIQTPFMYSFDGRPPFDEPKGRDVKGDGPFYRAYRAADGWFFLAVPQEDRDKLARLDIFGQHETVSAAEMEKILQERFGQKPIAEWMTILRQAEIAAHPIDKMAQTRDSHLEVEGKETKAFTAATFYFLRNERHGSGRYVDLVAPNAVRPLAAAITIPAQAPKPGQHSVAILKEFGYSDAEIADMIKAEVVGEQWSKEYLPV